MIFRPITATYKFCQLPRLPWFVQLLIKISHNHIFHNSHPFLNVSGCSTNTWGDRLMSTLHKDFLIGDKIVRESWKEKSLVLYGSQVRSFAGMLQMRPFNHRGSFRQRMSTNNWLCVNIVQCNFPLAFTYAVAALHFNHTIHGKTANAHL